MERKLFQHYKGDLYIVEGVAENSTNDEAGGWYVFYKSLEFGAMHCRRLTEFNEEVNVYRNKDTGELRTSREAEEDDVFVFRVPRFRSVKRTEDLHGGGG